jgi:phosphoribosylaminoimidazolecarboxamide formyltransferase/IMP cyclohydrolase
MAQRSFFRVSEYDRLIAQHWGDSSLDDFPKELFFGKPHPLRYGENPHQKGAWVGDPRWKQIQGKELSYNNLLDAEAAVKITYDFSTDACTLVKHNNPCGVAWKPKSDKNQPSLFSKALSSDPKSAFGGIVATNYEIQEEEAHQMSEIFLECVVAPQFSEAALAIFKSKSNLRVLEYPDPIFPAFEVKEAMGGYLLQEQNKKGRDPDFEPITGKMPPNPELLEDMKGLWLVCKHSKSNSIVIGRDHQTWGIGAGQVSRIDALEIALSKAQKNLEGSIIASDAFFPFRDSIDRLAGLGIRALIQPGGSRRDPEVIEACHQHQIPLFFTGERHFRH